MALAAICLAATAQNNADRDSVVACAQAGNDSCQNLLGKWIFEGSHGYIQDYEKAVAWWMAAAKKDNDRALANLGFCYFYGLGVKADSATAERLFEKAFKKGNSRLLAIHDSLANAGSAFSAALLGKCYKMAYGVRRDLTKSLKYYKMAADRGDVIAMREAAIMMRGNKDDESSVAMFKSAMQKGDVVATYYYGKMLCEGRGIAKDQAKGVSYIRMAAEKDYAAAQYELAEAYANGNGVTKNSAEALKWYEKAALGGNRASWWQLAESHRNGIGTAVDFEEALEYYAKASNEGFHNKLNAILSGENQEWKDDAFIHYLRGMRLLQVEGKPEAAMKEFEKLPKAMMERQVMVSLCMMHPSYAKRNMKKAVSQLTKLQASSRRAAFELALLQLKGEEMTKDVDKAEKTLAKMAKEGYSKAICFLADAYYTGDVLNKDHGKAVLLYLQAEKQQRLSAMGAARLAQAFSNGEGMKVDKDRAAKLEKYRAYDVDALLKKVPLQ